MSDHREEAEKLAGLHDSRCPHVQHGDACRCGLEQRVQAIEAALERAEAEGWQKGVQAVRRVVNTMCGGALVQPTEGDEKCRER